MAGLELARERPHSGEDRGDKCREENTRRVVIRHFLRRTCCSIWPVADYDLILPEVLQEV